MDKKDRQGHWQATKALMFTVLGLWAVFAIVVHWFVKSLNNIHIFAGFPLGYYMASQGSLFIFVVLIFWFASMQNKIDEKFSVAETD